MFVDLCLCDGYFGLHRLAVTCGCLLVVFGCGLVV